MRTTVTFAPDVAAALERVRRARSLGLSEAVNELIRAGLRRESGGKRFTQTSHPIGLRIDVTDVADALEQSEGPAFR